MSTEEINEAFRRMREVMKTFKATFTMTPFDSGTATALAKVVEGSIVNTTSTAPTTNPFDGINSLDDYIAWITPQLPPPPNLTPIRANQWTLDQLRKTLPTSTRPAPNEAFLSWRGLIIEVDDTLPDGIIKRGDEVLCDIKKDEEKQGK